MLQLIAWSLVVLSVLLDRHEMPSERHVHAPEEAPSPACIGNTENVIGIIKIRSRGVRYTREHTIPAGSISCTVVGMKDRKTTIMTKQPLENLNIAALDVMPSPEEIHARVPISDKAATTVYEGRETIKRILDRKDPRLFVVVGPCSIHDPIAGYDYAQRLKSLADEVRDTLYLVMRVYFEKPRTSIGWKGFINDPRMDDSFHIEEGMEKARTFLLQVTELGLPAATEALDPIAPQYLGDLISWTAIGARTSESQTHREMASGLSTPVGFKNGTDGNIDVAINAVKSSAKPHSFLGINTQGQVTGEAASCVSGRLSSSSWTFIRVSTRYSLATFRGPPLYAATGKIPSTSGLFL